MSESLCLGRTYSHRVTLLPPWENTTPTFLYLRRKCPFDWFNRWVCTGSISSRTKTYFGSILCLRNHATYFRCFAWTCKLTPHFLQCLPRGDSSCFHVILHVKAKHAHRVEGDYDYRTACRSGNFYHVSIPDSIAQDKNSYLEFSIELLLQCQEMSRIHGNIMSLSIPLIGFAFWDCSLWTCRLDGSLYQRKRQKQYWSSYM